MTVYLPAGWIVATGLWIGVALLVSLAIGLGVGKAIALGDEHDTADDADWLDDVPVDCLGPDEIDARFRQIVGTRSSREWTA